MSEPRRATEAGTARAAARSGPARERVVALVALVLGGALLLGAAGRTWATVRSRPAPGLPAVVDRVTGATLAPGVTAVGLLALAAVAGLLAVRGLARQLVGLVVLAAGVAALAYAVAGARATPRADGTVEAVSHGPWPWVAALGGALVAVAGALAVLHGRRWSALSSRYERSAGGAGGSAQQPAESGPQHRPPEGRPPGGKELWDALDRGEDPTERG
ncbi:MAG TPA: Trp biosynthesis-associated membrane protein [Motilibacteraceae bacterium]|nr:Trp biosynthesis-associated membrane protein [Motilibacteraceae bacterium]